MKILRTINQTCGFTITEVVISAVIFSLVVAGVFMSISLLKKPTVDSTEAMTAAFLGKRVLDDLRTKVDGETWDKGGPLDTGTYNNYLTNSIDGVTYKVDYAVSDEPSTSTRRVDLRVSW